MNCPLLLRAAAVLLLGVAPVAALAAPVEISVPEIRDAQQPQVAVNARGAVFIVFGSGSDLYLVSSRDGGKGFTPPVKIAALGKLALGMRRGPRITAVGPALTVTAINGADLLAFHSEDEGRTWAAPVKVNATATSAREGLHNLAASPQGQLYATWLDDRSGHKEIYGAGSPDGGKTWQKDELIYRTPGGGPVCECCHPSAAFNAKGDLVVMWRNSLGGFRDLWTAVRLAGHPRFESPAKQGAGTWKLAGCPMDGGSIAALDDGSFVSAFRREKDVFLALHPGTEQRLGEGAQPVAVNARGGLQVWWQQGADLVRAAGAGSAAPVTAAENARFPSAAVSPQDGSVVIAFERTLGQRKAVFAETGL